MLLPMAVIVFEVIAFGLPMSPARWAGVGRCVRVLLSSFSTFQRVRPAATIAATVSSDRG
ncbi:hypothetical protein TFLX_01478 [Thermoflexales bacterium]|nr:hypothetical protein TFLX_01478 [Thermoflexales bacterium]